MLAILIVTVIAACTSFLCSIMEAALYSIPPSKIEEMRRSGDRGGERLHRLRKNVDLPIAAILTLNTIANTIGASVAGGLVAAAYGSFASGVYGAIFTLIILFFSEIIPKTLGVTHANRIAPAMAGFIMLMIKVLWPFIMMSQLLTKAIRKGHEGDNAPSEDEILALAEMGAQAGTLLPDEARWAINALRLNDVAARELMTPRTVVYVLPADLPLDQVAIHSGHWTHSRLPVVRNNDPDQVEGIVHRREVFDVLVGEKQDDIGGKTLRDLAHPALFVSENIKCNELLRLILQNKQQLIVVSNEYGGMEGIISLEDIMEYILGEEIVDPHDKHADMQELARRVALRRRRRVEAGSKPSSRVEDDVPAGTEEKPEG